MFTIAPASGLGKPPQQGLLLGHCHVLALPPAHWLRLKRRDPAVVKGHVRAVHGAQRNPHRFRDGRLGHTALAQQHHLDALALRRMEGIPLAPPTPPSVLKAPVSPAGAFPLRSREVGIE